MDAAKPLGYTLGPNASQRPADETRLPFGLQVLILFLLLDAIERGVELVLRATAAPSEGLGIVQEGRMVLFGLALWVLVDAFMISLLLLKTLWGRILCQFILSLHLLNVVHWLVFLKPEAWLYLDSPYRLRLLLTPLIDLAGILYLFSDQARAHLHLSR